MRWLTLCAPWRPTGTPLDSYLGYDLASYSQTSDALGAFAATTNSSLRHTVSLGGGYKISGDQRLALMLALAMANTTVNYGAGDVNDSLTQLYSNLSYNLTF